MTIKYQVINHIGNTRLLYLCDIQLEEVKAVQDNSVTHSINNIYVYRVKVHKLYLLQ